MSKIIGIVLGIIGLYAIDYLIGVLVVWLICLCFGWQFSWAIASGMWLVVCVMHNIFKGGNSK